MSTSTRRHRVGLGIGLGFPALAAAVAALAILAGPSEAASARPADTASARPADTAGAAKQLSVSRAASLPAAKGQMTLVAEAGPLAAPKAGTPDAIAKWLLDKAAGVGAGQAFSFIFSAIGLNNLFPRDATSAQLGEIKAQLSIISTQLAQVQATLDSLIVDVRRSDFDVKLIALREKSNRLRTLLRGPFTRVVDAAADLEKLREGVSTPEQIEQAQQAVNARRFEFLQDFDRCCQSLADDIHAYLVPGPASSVLASFGRLKLGEKRYLTSADSADIRALYNMVAESEALASWMTMERMIPADPATVLPGTFPGSISEFNRVRREFLSFRVAEARNLPPMIPPGVVVDAGPSPRNSTNNVSMWVPASRNLRFQPGVSGVGTVPAALADLNNRDAEGFNDWRIPSQSAVTALLAGLTSNDKTPNGYLSGLNPASPAWQQIDKDSWPFVWSNNTVNQSVSCFVTPLRGTTIQVQTHTGVSTSTRSPVWSGQPRLETIVHARLGEREPADVCARYMSEVWPSASAAGGYIAERSTGVMPIDYTAIGAGPNLRPGANLRNADLQDFNLTGIDLTGADLTGATLTGAVFCDEDVCAPGANLTGTQLFGVRSGGIVGSGTLPAEWQLANGYLVGPGANLTGANLAGDPDPDPQVPPADLSSANLTAVVSGGVDCTGCELPAGWRWTGLPSGYLVGPGANLAGEDLNGLDLSGVNLSGADLSGASLRGANLSGANLSTANVANADFTGSNLTRVSSGGTFGTPAALPTDWRVVNGFLIGPGADLRGANLSGLNLTGANLTDADFTGANVSNALFTNATLVRITLTGADITGARFSTDNDNKFAGMVSGGLVGAPSALPASGRFRVVQGYLIGPSANLAGATFTGGAQLGVNLSGTNFTNATLTGLNLTGAFLNNAIFTGARLTGVNLTTANMSNATLDGVISSGITPNSSRTMPTLPSGWRLVNGILVGPGANLSGANLSGANLAFQDMSAANLTGANLSGALLGGANLEGADITGANVTGAQFVVTTCPDGVKRSTPCAPVVWLGSSTVTVSANKKNGKLSITVGPGVGGATWRVRVQRLSESGGWVAVSVHTTTGPSDPLSINLPNGTYRAVVPPQNRYRGSVSAAVVLAK